MSTSCLFCKIVSGDIPSRRIYEDDQALAFLDIFPSSKGHALVIPKIHCVDIHDCDEMVYSATARAVKNVADLLQKSLGSEGITVLQANREAGWQTVFHLHFHVIPRWDNDALRKPWDVSPGIEAELDHVHSLIVN